tara:strand:- start:548 stop:907 length:360 start_codon:yes stop_codon:yes gene_type:complete
MKVKEKMNNSMSKINGVEYDWSDAIENLLFNINVKYHESFPTNKDMVLSLVAGSKFVKVIHDNSVWGFIAKKDGLHKGLPMKVGDVFKPASWRAPAKHVRGSIFDTNTNWFRWTGPNYL